MEVDEVCSKSYGIWSLIKRDNLYIYRVCGDGDEDVIKKGIGLAGI